jgi:hypothetical protein
MKPPKALNLSNDLARIAVTYRSPAELTIGTRQSAGPYPAPDQTDRPKHQRFRLFDSHRYR